MQTSRASILSLLITLCTLSSVLFGCKEEKSEPDKPPAPPLAEAEKKEEKPEKPAVPQRKGHPYPVVPRMVFLPGKGASAIRFGATVETIERHMGAPCDKKTKKRCLYVRGAMEFFLKDGVLDRIKVHRRDRQVEGSPKGKDKYFGSVPGLVQPKIMLGLHRHVVLEEFGEPRKKEAVDPPGPDGLVDRHYYDGIIFEYDKIENGNVVLAGIEIYPSETPYAPPGAKGQIQLPPGGVMKGPKPNEPRAR